MIHIDTVNINVQMSSDEAGPTSVLSWAMHCSTPWLKASLHSKAKKGWIAKWKCNPLPTHRE